MNTSKLKETRAESAPSIIQLSELKPVPQPGESLLAANLDVVQNVKVRVSVLAGESTLTLGELMALRAGQVLALDSLIDTPLDILLEGKVVARGELVAVDDCFGVRIVDVPKLHAA